MKIAVVGAGAIGSAFAYQLAKAGHEVTAVARGARLEQLRRDGAVVLTSGERAAVAAREALDAAEPYDLVLVTVLATQVEAVLPALRASAARKVAFMFNTFESIEPLREAVGVGRFVFAFPGGVFALLIEGRLRPQINPGTTAGDAEVARVFSGAGIPTVFEADMQAWLRSHAAMVAPMMAASVVVFGRGAGLSWAEARRYAAAMAQGFGVVRALGHPVRPWYVAALAALPGPGLAAMLWAFSRTQALRDLGRLGPAEPRWLIDRIAAAAPGRVGELVAVRP